MVLLAMTAMTTTMTTMMMTAKQQNQPPVEAAIHSCHLERLLSAALQAERGSRPGWRRLQPWPRSRIRDGRGKRGACVGRHPLRRGPSRAIDVLSFAGNQFDRDYQQRRLRTIWEDDASGDQWRRWTALPPTSSATHKASRSKHTWAQELQKAAQVDWTG